MPRISAFYGIVILLHWGAREHPLAHFHARYGEYEASIDIATGGLLVGQLPRRALSLVQEWTELHRGELQEMWRRAQAHEELGTIEPLL
ncbi:MAG: DUF4160 domain-containing protein [Actinobacteria bacterium]|nr:MAG: DUF4160 domain-containing protein [Actinomycetota bacterium]